MASPADSQLIFGLFALNNCMITDSQLLDAFRAWLRDKSRPLPDYLTSLGYLGANDRSDLEAIVARHLEKHGGDAEKALSLIPASLFTVAALAPIADSDLQEALGSVAPLSSGPTYSTASRAPEPAEFPRHRFRILRPHAHGGLGKVSVALDAELDREVALKEILEKHADKPGHQSRLRLEGQITGRLEHPGIVPVYGLGTYEDGLPYYAMRFIRGDSLKDAIAQFFANEPLRTDPGARSLALRKLIRRFTDVCNAVEYAHSRGVLHRDLKPDNVIVGKHGETLVVDWGLAKLTGEVDPHHDTPEPPITVSPGESVPQTVAGSTIGTVEYMSPEQAAGRHDLIGPRSDVYGLGATLYHMFTGRAPFSRREGDVYAAVQRGSFPRPRSLDRSLDPALEAIVLKAMALDPSDRYLSPRALADDLDRWAADEPVQAYAEPFSVRARRWMRRNRTAVTAAAAALVVAAVGLGVVLAVQRKANTDLASRNFDLNAAIKRETAANEALRESNRQKDEANAALQLANQRVEERFDLARDAIRTFTASVQQDELLKNEKLKPVRDKLLRSAAGFYEKLEKLLQGQADRKSRGTLARSYEELGDLMESIGIHTEALKVHRKGVAVRRELAAVSNAGAAERYQLARSLLAVGYLSKSVGDYAAALSAYSDHREILTRLADENPSFPDYQNALAGSHNDFGVLLRDRGDNLGALSAFRKALEIKEKLAAENPTVTLYANSLAISQSNLGDLLDKTGDKPGSLRAYRRAIEIGEKLTIENPDIAEYRYTLANSHSNLGRNLTATGDYAGALRAYRRSLEIHEYLADAKTAVSRYQNALAAVSFNLGLLLSKTGDNAGALVATRRALAIWEKLAAENPAVNQYRNSLAISHFNLGNLLSDTGDRSGTLEAYRRALEIQQKLVTDYPDVPQFQKNLGASHNNLGILLRDTGEIPGAFIEVGQALAIYEKLVLRFPEDVEFRTNLALTLDTIGRLAWAKIKLREADAAFRREAVIYEALHRTASNLYNAACAHALAAEVGSHENSGKTPAAVRHEADLAMEALRESIAAGYRDLNHIEADTDLNILRSRPDFQLLLLDLAFPEKPFAP
jgi:serine/threonine-protein kinase